MRTAPIDSTLEPWHSELEKETVTLSMCVNQLNLSHTSWALFGIGDSHEQITRDRYYQITPRESMAGNYLLKVSKACWKLSSRSPCALRNRQHSSNVTAMAVRSLALLQLVSRPPLTLVQIWITKKKWSSADQFHCLHHATLTWLVDRNIKLQRFAQGELQCLIISPLNLSIHHATMTKRVC